VSSDFFTNVALFFKNNRFAVILAALGVVLAILFITVGFLKTLLILLLAVAGGAAGMYLDKRLKNRNEGNGY